ncbi:MAG: C cytochrome precursor [Planctomycetales bacterium]
MSTLSVLASLIAALIVFGLAQRALGRGVAAVAAILALAGVLWLTSGERKHRTDAARVARQKDSDSQVQFADNVPQQVSADGYVSSEACRECHPRQHATWHASYHRTMTQPASPETVFGNFDDQTLEFGGTRYALSRRGDEFWVHVDFAGDRPAVDRPIVLVTGSHHMQVYWMPIGQGRTLAELPIYYLREDRRWVPRDASFLKPYHPEQGNAEVGRWNTECILCHTTHGRSRPRVGDGVMAADSEVGEFGISCEACHGPGEQHVEARRTGRGDDRIVNPATLPSQRSAQVCGRCHSITLPQQQEDLALLLEDGYQFRPGNLLADTLHLTRRDRSTRERLKAGIVANDQQADVAFDMQFWRDGMVRVSGREFNGLVESACYQQGEMSCVSCHDLHNAEDAGRSLADWSDDQLKPHGQSSGACTQCHAGARYATTDHTHHRSDTAGSDCMNCHMPHTTYGLLKAIRSHTIDRPSVTASVQAGRPNACNLCHLDQTLGWAADHLERWYAIAPPELDEEQRKVSAAALWSLKGDAGQRALIAWHMGWPAALEVSGTNWQAPYLAHLLEDPYPAVRYIALRSLRNHPGFEAFDYDFVGSNREVADGVRRVLAHWRTGEPAGDSPRLVDTTETEAVFPGRVLINSERGLLQDDWERLKRTRDNTPVSLAE